MDTQINKADAAESALDRVRGYGKEIDFGKTAPDYAKHRAGFPEAFFDRLAQRGIVRNGARALDLGTGTGTIARGLARRGMEVVGLDKSDSLMEQARQLSAAQGVSVEFIKGFAEATSMPDRSFDLITAGQCWYWFDRAKAAAEARRILKPRGAIVLANFDWIPLPGNIADLTEKLIEKHNPSWKLGGGLGMHPHFLRDLGIAGFAPLESYSFDEDTPYTHEGWRGRIRASAGVGASMDPEQVERFDSELAQVLKDNFPDPTTVLHRIFTAIGTAP